SGHLNEIERAKGGTELILNATLEFQTLHLDPMCAVRNLMGCQSSRRQRVESTDQRDRYRRRGAGGCACRYFGVDCDLQRVLLRQHHLSNRGFEQPMAIRANLARYDCIALAIVLGVQDNAVRSRRPRKDCDLHLDIGVDPDIEYLPLSSEPRIGPAADVADANRRDAVDDAQGDMCFSLCQISPLLANRPTPETGASIIPQIG